MAKQLFIRPDKRISLSLLTNKKVKQKDSFIKG